MDSLDDKGREPTLDDLLALRERALVLGLRVSAPAIVTKVEGDRVDVRLGFLPVTEDGTTEPAIECPAVPVAWPATSAGYMTLPLVPGDRGLVVFGDRNLGEWLRLGVPADPISGRAHDLADGVFLPGGPRPAGTEVPLDATATVLDGPQVKIGAEAVSAVALAAELHTYLAAMITAAPVAPNDGGATFKAALLTYLGANPPTGFASAKGRG